MDSATAKLSGYSIRRTQKVGSYSADKAGFAGRHGSSPVKLPMKNRSCKTCKYPLQNTIAQMAKPSQRKMHFPVSLHSRVLLVCRHVKSMVFTSAKQKSTQPSKGKYSI